MRCSTGNEGNGMATTYWLVGYDIQDDSIRSRVHRQMKKVSTGYQKSVFEMPADHESAMVFMEGMAEQYVEAGDKLLLLHTGSLYRAWSLGIGNKSPIGGIWLIN